MAPSSFFFRKMILAKICYLTHKKELLTIVEALKTWRPYLKSYKYKVFMLTDYNNSKQFMDMKSLNSY